MGKKTTINFLNIFKFLRFEVFENNGFEQFFINFTNEKL